MTFLEKLDALMAEKKLNKHTLAERCGVPYTTIVGLYERGPDNARLSTLQKICNFLNVQLDYMVYDKYEKQSDFVATDAFAGELNESDRHAITLYRNAEPAAQQIALEILESHQIQEPKGEMAAPA